MDLPTTPDPKFNKAQLNAWKAMMQLLRDPADADRRYDALADSAHGRIISTDLARFLDDRYAKPPRKGRTRDLAPGWDLAWRYAQDRFERELRSRGKRKVVRFMAGGWAAGKTHALEHMPTPELAWDGTLRDTDWAADMIDLALAKGWHVVIAYVFRDLELAFYGAMERAGAEGRMVPLAELPGMHRAVQKSILDLTAAYLKEERVAFVLLHNLGTEKVRCRPWKISRKDLDAAGGLHYTAAHESYYVQAASQIGEAAASSDEGYWAASEPHPELEP